MTHLTQTEARKEDKIDRALRPTTFDGFLGQTENKANLKVYVDSALARGEALDHVLLEGPPGLGKTTLSAILANELGARFVVVHAPSIRTKGELATLLTGLRKGDVLLLDEIHSINARIEEILYPAMEDYELQIVAGGRALTIKLEPFTLIGATTRAGALTRPLRERFGVTVTMRLYTVEELTAIVQGSAIKLGIEITQDGAVELARRSRGTPRIANGLLRRVRDFALAAGTPATDAVVRLTCERLGIDELGLDRSMQEYLRVLVDKGKALGLNTLVSLLGADKATIEDVIEPHLMRLGLVEKTAKGREATAKGRRHLYIEH